MDGFERRKTQKKDSIRRAALELFQTYGFQKVSVNEIAKRAGVSQVTIYNHFGSKEGVVRDVMKWQMLNIFEKYKNMMESELPFIEKLENIVLDKTQLASQFQGELLQAVMQGDPEVRDFVEELYINDITPVMKSFFDEGIQQGYISSEFSMETIIFYFEIIRRGFYNMPDITERTGRNPEILKELIRLMTYGLNG